MKYYEEQIKVHDADKIILYTDGLYEDLDNFTESKMGFEIIHKIIYQNQDLPVGKLISKIIEERDKIKSKTQEDDIAILGLEIKEE